MRVWITKVSSFNLNTRTRVKLHANACNYKISKFYTQLITRTVHSLSTHCPRTVHENYTQTTRILRACRCCNPFDQYCMLLWSNLSLWKLALQISLKTIIMIIVICSLHAWPYLLFPPGIPCCFHICRTVTIRHCSTDILQKTIKKQLRLINYKKFGEELTSALCNDVQSTPDNSNLQGK